MSTGAYNYAMASNYNRIPRPAVVMVKDGKDRIIVQRETYDDLLTREL
jgi:diaminopimelate decarboxylase